MEAGREMTNTERCANAVKQERSRGVRSEVVALQFIIGPSPADDPHRDRTRQNEKRGAGGTVFLQHGLVFDVVLRRPPTDENGLPVP
jgi:hypothetical protein